MRPGRARSPGRIAFAYRPAAYPAPPVPHAHQEQGPDRAFAGTKKPTPITELAPASLPVWLDPLFYCGCGSDRRLLSSCMSTATSASALACWRPWCAQKSSSPELASSTRTYAWAPQRSQTSKAVSGLVGAIAPVNVAFLRVVPPAFQPSGFSFCPYSSAQHIPRLQRSPLQVVYATSETTRRPSVAQLLPCDARCLRPTGTRGQYRWHTGTVCLYLDMYPDTCWLMHSSWSVWDFGRSGRVALPGAYGPERYYFR